MKILVHSHQHVGIIIMSMLESALMAKHVANTRNLNIALKVLACRKEDVQLNKKIQKKNTKKVKWYKNLK